MKLFLAFPFPTINNTYVDRLRMFASLAEWLDEVTIITAGSVEHDLMGLNYPNLKIINLGHSFTKLKFTCAACSVTSHVLNTIGKKGEEVVLHDLFMARLSPLTYRLRSRFKVITLLSLYSPNVQFLIDRGWRAKTGRLSPRLEGLHFANILQRIISEAVSSRIADIMTGNCDMIRDNLIKYYRIHPKKVMTVPAEVDTDRFCPRQRFNKGTNIFNILYVGHICANKGIYDLLYAFKHLSSRLAKIRLTIVGSIYQTEKEKFTQFLDRSKANGKEIIVKSTMPQNELIKLYQQADLFVFPSYYEGSPRVVKEAVACGCPAIVTDIPGTRIIDPKGEFLTFVPVASPYRLAREIQKIIDQPSRRVELAELGRQYVTNHFNCRLIAQRLYSIYKIAFKTKYSVT